MPGSVLLMQVRIRERGERLNVGVQDVVRFEENFLPPVWATESTPISRPSPPIIAPVNAPVERSAAPPSPYVPPVIEDSFDPSEPPEPASEVAPPMPEPAERYSPIAPQPARRECLRLVLQEGADEDEDQKRLSQVFRLLQQQPGKDDVFLTIKTREGDDVELKLPTASLDEGLRASLEEAVGMSREAMAV